MNALILEDETIAAQSLQRQLQDVRPEARVLAVLQTVEEAEDWFKHNEEPDLAFMDIHLADGSVFRLFDSIAVHCPIIFTTAYDQYALQAFKVNSVDYLLKPIDAEELRRALDKHDQLVRQQNGGDEGALRRVVELLRNGEKQYKSYFLIPVVDKLVPLATQDIACIYLENKVSIAITTDGKSHVIDKPLDAIMQELDPVLFFRANRQYIVAHNAIKDIVFWFGNKLRLSLGVDTPDKVIIAKARVSEFKQWFTR